MLVLLWNENILSDLCDVKLYECHQTRLKRQKQSEEWSTKAVSKMRICS